MARWREELHPRDNDGRFAGGTHTGRATQVLNRASHVQTQAGRPPAARNYRPGTDQTEWTNTNTNDISEMMSGALGPGDRGLTAIARQQGWGRPAVGSRTDVDDAIGAGWIEAHRGVQPGGGMTARQISDDARTNDDHVLGTGIYGNGVYTSERREVAEEFGRGRDGDVTRMAINPEARIIDYDDLERERTQWYAEVQASGRVMGTAELFANDFQVPEGMIHPALLHEIAADPGRYAAMRGYDVIRVTGQPDGGRARPGARLNTSRATQYVVLNRTAMLVEDGP